MTGILEDVQWNQFSMFFISSIMSIELAGVSSINRFNPSNIIWSIQSLQSHKDHDNIQFVIFGNLDPSWTKFWMIYHQLCFCNFLHVQIIFDNLLQSSFITFYDLLEQNKINSSLCLPFFFTLWQSVTNLNVNCQYLGYLLCLWDKFMSNLGDLPASPATWVLYYYYCFS